MSTLTSEYRNKISSAGFSAPIGANGSPLDVLGQITMPVSIGNFTTEQVFVVVNTLAVDCLLGADYLVAHGVIIDYKRSCVVIQDNEIPFTLKGCIATTLDASTCNKVISVLNTITIPGRAIQLLDVSLPDEAKAMGLSNILVEPDATANIPKHVFVARTFSPVFNSTHAIVQVMNINPTAVTLYGGTKLGEFTPLEELLLVETPCQNSSLNCPPKLNIDFTHGTLSLSQQQDLLNLLHDYQDLFASNADSLGRTAMVRHAINTEGPPIRQSMRRQPAVLRTTIDSEVQKMLQQGVIQPSFSPWSSPVVMVKKKDGTWRFCIDYRKLNDVTHRDAYPLPRVDATLDSLAGSMFFTTLDLASGYWQVELEPNDKEKTAFSTSKGHFEFNVMPFGLTNAPATFQRLMECALAGLVGDQCLIYLDDIIIFSSTFTEHLKCLACVFDRLRAAGLRLKAKKCHFIQEQVTYLGHIISNKGIAPDKAKLTAVTAYPTPRTTKEVKQFMGISNYYRNFIPSYAHIAEPLHCLLRKSSKTFNWTKECQESFDTLKSKLTTPPILAFPRFTDPFMVSTDASDRAIGGVLSQKQDGHDRVIAYWSRQLTKAERNYSTIEREALAIVGAVKEFYPYLYGFKFQLFTDHNPLTSLKTLKDTGGRLTRWLLFLQQFDFTIAYKKGTNNSNADALSRRPPDNHPTVSAVGTCIPLADSDTLANAQQNDSQLADLKCHIEQGTLPQRCPRGLCKCFIKDGLLCREYKDSTSQMTYLQIVVPPSLKTMILQELHNNMGHFGTKKTFDQIKTRFYWPGYERDVESWIKECEQCQKRKPPQPNPPAPLGTLQATAPFEILSWDIMGPLPISSQGNKYILVVTDIFTKWVEAFALKDTTANTLATVLLDEIICRYGAPCTLHSDQGANLCSSVIQCLCALLGVSTTRTSAYHPEGNGQVERFNRTLEAIIAKTITDNQHDWDRQLPKVLFAYRTAIHETTHFSPFHLMFGRSPKLPVDLMLARTQPSKLRSYPQFVQDSHKQLTSSYTIAKQQLQAQHLRQKHMHDSSGSSEPFQIGDRVWLYTPVVNQGRTRKFASFWKGPYTIIDKPGEVTYKVQLIGGTQTLVVHRNRLKPCLTPPPLQTNTAPAQHPQTIPDCVPTYADVTTGHHVPQVGGYTSVEPDYSTTRPTRARRPPTRYDDYLRY